MPDEPPQISILDARLAEIDKRLRTIQTGLVTGPPPTAPASLATRPAGPEATAEPPPRVEVPEPGAPTAGLRAVSAPAPAPPPGPADSLVEAVAQLHELAAAHESLLTSMRGLLSDYAHALAQAPSARAAAARGEEHSVTVTAGPFASTEAVRGFESALSALPGVRGVELRGYEGGSRAIVDVHLSPTS